MYNRENGCRKLFTLCDKIATADQIYVFNGMGYKQSRKMLTVETRVNFNSQISDNYYN